MDLRSHYGFQSFGFYGIEELEVGGGCYVQKRRVY